MRRISIALARSSPRLSSAFSILFALASLSVYTQYLVSSRRGIVRPESRADFVHHTSKSSPRIKPRTKTPLSKRPKLASPRSNLFSPSRQLRHPTVLTLTPAIIFVLQVHRSIAASGQL